MNFCMNGRFYIIFLKFFIKIFKIWSASIQWLCKNKNIKPNQLYITEVKLIIKSFVKFIGSNNYL